MKLRENVKAALHMLFDAIMAACSLYDTDFLQLTEWQEAEVEYSLFQTVDLVLIDLPYNVQVRNSNLKNDVFTREDI